MTETDAFNAKGASVPLVGILVGYARCSTEKQDLSAQREILRGLGVPRGGSIWATA